MMVAFSAYVLQNVSRARVSRRSAGGTSSARPERRVLRLDSRYLEKRMLMLSFLALADLRRPDRRPLLQAQSESRAADARRTGETGRTGRCG